MRQKGISSLKVAATYIGTIVGAGFATGQEVLQFFNRFGILGLGGLLIATVLFIVFGYIIMDLGNALRARSHLEVIRHAGGNILGTFTDLVITVFLFGSLTAMIAGTGALFEQQLKIPPLPGNLLMAIITALTVLTGINGVINSISYVVPFLLLSVFGICIYSVMITPVNLKTVPVLSGRSGIINHWLAAAILYVSYNTVISIAILGPLGVSAQSRKVVWNGAVLGGLGLGAGAVMIYTALSSHAAEIVDLEVPMVFIAGSIMPGAQFIYAIVLIAEIYTTAVGALFGFASRVVDVHKTPGNGKKVILLTSLCALLASQLGFSNLVKFMYPVVGYCGAALLCALVITTLREKNSVSS
ncbi:MAG: hypothetical protein GX144_06945 [Clostridiaceae bacterium]|nr:hypothetical protein [Clostridiaceae bacterium]